MSESETNPTNLIRLALIHDTNEFLNEPEKKYFSPLFVHQIFPEDTQTPEEPMFELIYRASDLSLCFRNLSSVDNKLRSCLEKVINHPFSTNLDDFTNKKDTFSPYGRKIHEYKIKEQSNLVPQNSSDLNATYEIYLGDFSDHKFVQFHRRMQLFTLLFIDGASFIEENDDRWLVYTLFKREELGGDIRYSFIGFSTVYQFYSYPDKIRRRVSQFVILPPFQNRGHGFHLLSHIFCENKNDKDCVELLVEDPTDDFQNLRLIVEMKICFDEKIFTFEDNKYWNLTKDDISAISSQVRICSASVKRIHEIFKQEKLRGSSDQKELKAFRLRVKTRLYKSYECDLESLEEDQKKEKLESLFEDAQQENSKLWNRFGLIV
eukprot:c13991_g1_i1.p1 GENE.c13991_g1_i1~~c13991_g1_i1.p1  ORF type:complete len:377 (-),score=128.85 c13991_g1_i1:33-1163(-)